MNYRPSVRLNYAVGRGNYSKGILFGMARDDGAGRTVPSLPKNAVEYHDRNSVLLALNQIPDLCDLPA